MNQTILNTFAESFSTNVVLLAGQRKSDFEGTVEVQDISNSKAGYVPALNSVVAQKITSRLQKVNFADAEFTNTRIPIDGYSVTLPVADPDHLSTAYEIDSVYMKRTVQALNIEKDKIIIAAATGDAYRGSNSAPTANALPATQTIAHGSAGMTLAKVVGARRILSENEAIQDGDELSFAMGAKQIADVMELTQFTSRDFTNNYSLESGRLAMFYGFKIVETQRLNKTGNIRDAFAWVKDGIVYGNNKDISGEAQPRYDLDGAYQIRADFYGGAARVDDKKVVKVESDES